MDKALNAHTTEYDVIKSLIKKHLPQKREEIEERDLNKLRSLRSENF